jgi:hypothetical protein
MLHIETLGLNKRKGVETVNQVLENLPPND